MKRFAGYLLLGGLLVSYAAAHPGLKRESGESVESGEDIDDTKPGVLVLVPYHRSVFEQIAEQNKDRPNLHTSIWDSPLSAPSFENVFTRMQELMKKLSANFESALLDGNLNGNLNQSSSPWGFKIPSGANSTSKTKVVGNHTVTVNETTHSENNEFGHSVVHWKIIEVKPMNETISSADKAAESTDNNDNGNNNNDKVSEDNLEEGQKSEDKPTVADKLEDPDTENNKHINEIPKSQVEIIRA